MIFHNSEIGFKCIERRSPDEPLGIVAVKQKTRYEDIDNDGAKDLVVTLTPMVVPFRECVDEMRKQRGKKGGLHFESGEICQYVFRFETVRKLSDSKSSAFKKHDAVCLIPKA